MSHVMGTGMSCRSAWIRAFAVSSFAVGAAGFVGNANGGECVPPAVAPAGPRYFTVTPSASNPGLVAILMTIDTTGPACGGFIDLHPDPDLRAAGVGRILTFPIFRPTEDWGSIHVRADIIIPATTYNIQVDCGVPGTPDLSVVVPVTTPVWGDVAGAFTGSGWLPPDGTVDIVADALAVIDAFRGTATAPPIQQTDLFPQVGLPDYVIEIFDLVMVLDAFRGLAYRGDCNTNGMPDVCDLENGVSADCNGNGIPDECDPDCDDDGIPDDCDVFEDCDSDGIQDCVDLCTCTTPLDRPCICPELGECCFDGFCLADFPHDECIASGGTPECAETACRDGCLIGDFDDDGDVDSTDFENFQACFGGPDVQVGPACKPGDFDDDGDIDCDDWNGFVLAWTEVSPVPTLPGCSP